MTAFYSPSTGRLGDIRVGVAPSDAIALTQPEAAALLAGVNNGQIVTVIDGVPTLKTALASAPTPAQLLAHAESLRGKIAAGGIVVNIATPGASPQMVEVGTDTTGLALLANAVQLSSTAPGTPYNWDQNEPATLTGAQIIAIQVAVGLFQQLLFAEKTAIRAAIAAGTITTLAQIDDPTLVNLPAWPANS